MEESSIIQLGENEYSVVRYKLRKWLELEDIRAGITKSTNDTGIDRFVESIYAYIFMAIGEEIKLDRLPWYEVIKAYNTISSTNAPRLEFPLFRSNAKDIKVPWDYDGRTWYIWSHALSSEFGWTLEYVANLDIDDAIGLLQEIMVSEQLEKEFEWGISEIAYVYNPSSKKSEFRPMDRPNWMEQIISGELKKVRIKKSHLPVGNVIHLGGMDEAIES